MNEAAGEAAGRQDRGTSSAEDDSRRRLQLGAAPLLALAASAGLVVIALGNNAARDGSDSGPLLFWGGLIAIYAPITFRLLSTSAAREERISLALVLGISLFVVKILAGPTGFERFDELGTYRATYDAIQTGSLFSTNPLVISTSGFPGLEAFTAALAQLAHLSIFHAGLMVIGSARAATMCALFLFIERATASARAAGIGVAIYACNPSFLYFDSQFGYESLALAVAAALLLLSLSWTEGSVGGRARAVGAIAAMATVAWTLTVTHHMTAAALLAFLVLWAALAAAERPSGGSAEPSSAAGCSGGGGIALRLPWTTGPALPALLLATAMAFWFAFVAGAVTVDELGGVISNAFDSAVQLVSGGEGPKALFKGGGETNSVSLRALALASVVPLLALLPFGVRRTWFGPEANPLWRALALVGLLYPVTLGLRLTAAGSEVSQRASEFTFLGVAVLAALVVGDLQWPERWWRRNLKGALLAAVATAVFLGGVVLGELPSTRQPGPFVVGADAGSVSPRGLNAAAFAADHLPAGSRVISDRSNATLLAAYGHVDPVFGRTGEIPVPRVLFGRRWGKADRIVIRDQRVDYILVDRRLSRELPAIGFYVESDEPQANSREEPISREALRKFDRAPGLRAVFDNGPITIYDTSEVRSG